ncbi:MAG: DEAD/DEAH box helicase [Rhodospirillales bacterium]|jgi:superfamily II DNA/RNA helicase|nr:DEAD/DEAH box helicase [Rhodospirillales bacterium]
MKFSDLGLSQDVLRAVTDAGYAEPTPIQAEAIPIALMGRDILGCAQTGTGKTAGFTLPMIEILAAGHAKARMPRSLILEPTRELATQVAESFEVYGKHHKLSKALLIGGVSLTDQMKVVDHGVDVLIATPGRLLDMFERGRLLLTNVKILVIDEADRMLDMGFIPDVEKIVSLVSRMRQTLFFSATMPPEIKRLADKFLSNPKLLTVSPPSTAAATVEQSLVMVKTERGAKPGSAAKDKRAALRRVLETETVKNALIFCNRKRDIGVVHRSLNRRGYNAGQLHGDMVQSARTETLESFKRGEIRLLVCSDVAARGLDIQNMSHVFNFDVPSHAEDYIHRIGRTGRAGREGKAITFASGEDRKYLAAVTKLLGKPIPAAGAAKAAPKAEAVVEAVPEEQPAEKPATPEPKVEAEPKAEAKPARPKKQEPAPAKKAPEKKAAEAKTEKPAKAKKGAPEKKAAKPQAARKEAREPRQSKRRGGGSGESVRGMGDHTPAFMLRPVPKAK